MKTLLYVATFIGGILGAFVLFGTVLADSAPQQGAGAAVAVALVVIPYCMARVIGEARKEHLLEELVKSRTHVQSSAPPQPTMSPPSPAPYPPSALNPFAPKRN